MKKTTSINRSLKQWARRLVPVALPIAVLICGTAQAVEIDAGDYAAAPPGTDVGLLYLQQASRNKLYANGKLAPGSNGLDSQIGILRYVHFMDIGGITVDPQILVPVVKLKGTHDLSAPLGSSTGAADIILAATAWLVNKPDEKTFFGVTPFLWVPTGKYDSGASLNIGENRWKFALQAAGITPLSDKVTLDLSADVTFHGENDKFGVARQTLKQKPVYQFQSWLRYQLSPAADLRMQLSHTTGGGTSIDGVNQSNRQATSKYLVGASWWVAPKTQLLGLAGSDLSVRDGFKESFRFNFRLLQVF